jgi:putative ABC transport system permease protein
MLQDVRYAIRTLLKNPGFTATAILVLAIGIGANTAIFTVVNAVLLRPLPFRDPGSLCLLTERLPFLAMTGPSYQNFVDWQAQAHSFEGIAGARNTTFTLTGAGEPERLQGQMATANLFPLLGVEARTGRTFRPEEDRAESPIVALLSRGLALRRFGSEAGALGQKVVLNDEPYTVIGILPAGFRLIQPADVVVAFAPWAAKLPDDRSWHPGIIAIGRLRPDVGIEVARSEMSVIAERLAKQYPEFDTDVSADVNGLQEQAVQNIRPALLVLLGAVGLVLLIACANVANLLLARAVSRRREIAVRTAIGAGPLRILSQLLTESVILALAGGAAGVLLAAFGLEPLVRLASNTIPNAGPIQLDSHVLWFAAAASVLSGILFGTAPALQTGAVDLRTFLNETSRGCTAGPGTGGMRSFLVMAQIALALVLLVGAGLLLRSFERLQSVPPGFRSENLLVGDLPVSPNAHKDSAERMEFFDRILDRVRMLPGVQSAGAAANLPVSGVGSIIHFNIQGRAPKTAHDYIAVGYRPVTGGYLETLGVPLLKGRLITDADTERSEFVAVVNRAMELRYFPGESAIGKHVQLGALPDKDTPYMEIVGVVGDMKQNLATDPDAEMYVPFRQGNSVLPIFALSYVLRTATSPRAEISALRSAIREIDSNQPVVKIRTMEENISTSMSEPRFRAVLLGIFAASALLLSIVGLYGLMVYSVNQRVQEIGIRITLGAQRGDVLRMVVGEGLILAAIGIAAGVVGAFVLSRILERFLYGVTHTDPLTYGGVAVLLLAVALVASYVPARRATSVDPMQALRHE